MDFIITAYVFGLLNAATSIFFRIAEIKNKTLYLGKNFFITMLVSIVCFFIARYFFADYVLHLPGIGMEFSWVLVYFLVYFISYYQIKIIFEMFGGDFYPSEQEIKDFIEKNQNK